MDFHFGEVDGDVVIPVVEIFNGVKNPNGQQNPYPNVIDASLAFCVELFIGVGHFCFPEASCNRSSLSDLQYENDKKDHHQQGHQPYASPVIPGL